MRADGRQESKRIPFTVAALDALPIPKQGRYTRYDADSELALRVDANGRKSFFWFKTGRDGKAIFRSLGAFPATPIQKARLRAANLQATLDDWRERDYQGEDPFAEEEAKRKVPTFGEAVENYIQKRVRHHAARPEKAETVVRQIVDIYLADWKKKSLADIQSKHVRARHADLTENKTVERTTSSGEKKKPKGGAVTADRVIQLVRRIYKYAIEKDESWKGGSNPCRGVEYNGYTSRSRYLGDADDGETARLFAALSESGNLDLRDFVFLALFTGARRGDVLSMRWKNVLFENNTLLIPDPKGGEEHSYRVPLVPEAIEVLKARRERGSASPWVFPSRSETKTGHLVEMKNGFAQLLKHAKIENFHIHDLRRSLASWQAAQGVSQTIIGKTLGHAPGSTATSVYSRLNLDAPRAAMMNAIAAMRAVAETPKPKRARLSAPKALSTLKLLH
jgi:integrase